MGGIRGLLVHMVGWLIGLHEIGNYCRKPVSSQLATTLRLGASVQ